MMRRLVLFSIILISLLVLTTQDHAAAQDSTPTPTPVPGQIKPDYYYVHSSGLFSIPHLEGWDQTPAGQEEKADTPNSSYGRAGVVFKSTPDDGVIYVFAEKGPFSDYKAMRDLEKLYTKPFLDQVWVNYSSWTETTRRFSGNRFAIDFKVVFNNKTYLARQIARFESGSLVTLQLIVPDPNLTLLNRLDYALWSTIVFYPQEANTPVTWGSTLDSENEYFIKYPSDWAKTEGDPGSGSLIEGTLQGTHYTLTTKVDSGKSARIEKQARDVVTALHPDAKILAAQVQRNGSANGFVVSYSVPGTGSKAQSGVIILLNGINGKLYSADLLAAGADMNMLDTTDKTVPPEVAQIVSSFLIFPPLQLPFQGNDSAQADVIVPTDAR
ncbi:MAG: hypothetical protein ABI947_05715 [Chloroflexota bacterium]